MAPLPDNNTRRYWLDYSCGGVQHSTMIRTSGIFSPANFGSSMNSILNLMSGLLFQITIVGCRTAAEGSDVSLPVTTGIEGNTYGSGSPGNTSIPCFYTLVGRSSGGRRVKATFYGATALDTSFRLTPAEQSAVGDVVDAFNLADGFGYAIDNLSATWYPYFNNGLNAYWQRKRRS